MPCGRAWTTLARCPHLHSANNSNNGATVFVNNIASGSTPVTVFGAGGGDAIVNDNAIGNILVATTGNTTLNASGSGGGNIFFDSAGAGTSVTMVGGQFYNYFVAGAGNATMEGGQGPNSHNFFQFTNGAAGGNDLSTKWTSNDNLDFYGYGSAAPSQSAGNGGVLFTLSDGTKITVSGVSSIPASQIHG